MKPRIRTLLQSVAAVFAGGVLGSLIRISLGTLQAKDASWPWMTMLINLTGAFILGCLLEFLGVTGEDVGARRLWRLGLGTGVIGGYTTYSTFILESDTRLTGHAVALALAYLVLSVVAGLICAGLGIGAGSALGARRNARATLTSAPNGKAEVSGSDSDPDAENEEAHS
ncbi:MAG: CrcB family protein [Bifidobacterium sp.]|nr:CrcB family protein [Bifidobacterium sp.]